MVNGFRIRSGDAIFAIFLGCSCSLHYSCYKGTIKRVENQIYLHFPERGYPFPSFARLPVAFRRSQRYDLAREMSFSHVNLFESLHQSSPCCRTNISMLQVKVGDAVDQSWNLTDIYINFTEIFINSTDICINLTEILTFNCGSSDFILRPKGVSAAYPIGFRRTIGYLFLLNHVLPVWLYLL